jgi:hypothetical protein
MLSVEFVIENDKERKREIEREISGLCGRGELL